MFILLIVHFFSRDTDVKKAWERYMDVITISVEQLY